MEARMDGLENPTDEDLGSALPRQFSPNQSLSSQQAYEAAYRFVSRYYDHERTAAIRRLLESMSLGGGASESDTQARSMWHASVEATLDSAPLPPLPPAWDS
jgi:hypothetical protein